MNEKLPYARSYKTLSSYMNAMELADQIRRSSRSVGAQIAEAWGKRRYIKHIVSKITDAYAETYETEHWITTAYRCGYIKKEVYVELTYACSVICKLLGGMIYKADQFCD